ncbi:MAG: hypothetical protein WBC44_12250 [Planctomycetaceae bacterium]
MHDRPKRPWWRKKRWIAAAALWLLLPIAYPLSLGPASYACRLGWIPVDTYNAFWGKPLRGLTGSSVSQATGFQTYFEWWVRIGRLHERSGDSD